MAAVPSAAGAIRRVACQLEFQLSTPAVLALQVAAASTAGDVLDEHLGVSLDGAETPSSVSEVATYGGGRMHVVRADAGWLAISYRASVRPKPAPPAAEATEEVVVDAESIAALRQSRYCPSDALGGFAAVELAGLERGPTLARSVASWVFERLGYIPGSSDTLDTAIDTLLAGVGSCRDFSHLTIALCRALGVPARLVAVYAAGLSPMDFHAVVEARRGTGWEVLDATRLAPRSSLTRIATGRDAADTAFATTLSGQVDLMSSLVSAVVDDDLPGDDHIVPVTLA
ncbi:MAG TPA: transglutaminase family protein [Acidimicrobiia bacterium]|nr:transglutaminase family protein [Acidimicrobiia bacterium]